MSVKIKPIDIYAVIVLDETLTTKHRNASKGNEIDKIVILSLARLPIPPRRPFIYNNLRTSFLCELDTCDRVCDSVAG
jgi:hypothetical protein